MKIKSFFVRNIIRILRSFVGSAGFLGKKLGVLRTPVFWFGRSLFNVLVFPVYKVLYLFRYKTLNVYAPAKSRVFYVLNKSYLIHVFVVVIAFVVVVNNLNAQELREERFGERTIVYSLVTQEEYEELTEEGFVELPQEKILSYLDNTTSIEKQPSIETSALVDEQLITEISTVTQGGTALVKPNIIKPISADKIPSSNIASRTGITKYTVQSGDTLSTIATKFSISTETLLWQNSLSSRSVIKPGDSLEVLPVSGVSHTVKSGETISAIAKKYGIESDKIVSYNDLETESSLKVGQGLIVPGGKITTPYVSSQPSYAYGTAPVVSPITKLLAPSPAAVVTSGLVWPAGVRRISQYYSWRHTGLDIAGPVGTPLYASDSGKVIYSGWSNGYGYNVLIDHENGMKTRYAHASKLYVSVGDRVTKGQSIAGMGSTGWSTGPHIHYEVIVNGVKKNPLSYIK